MCHEMPSELFHPKRNLVAAELSVTALAQAACRYEVNGRERKKALSFSLVFKSESPAATCLPRPLQDSEYFAVFAKLTDDDEAALKKKKNRLLVRRKVTGALGSLYGANLEQYRSVPVNEDFPLLARCTAHCLTQTTCSRICSKVPAP